MTQHTLEIQDIMQFQAEAGRVEAELRLRAIIAERKVAELEVELATLQREATSDENVNE